MAHCLLEDLGILRFRGPDAQKFLQGQLSNDVQQLTAGALLRAGLHNPHGRTLALLALISGGEDDVLALLPKELMATVTPLLRRYVLRSKVMVSDESERYRIYGLAGLDESERSGAQRCAYGAQHDGRQLLLQDAAKTPIASPVITREQWRSLDIAAGLPQVSEAISGQFVAQMLNLDCIGAISFSKGCYTGQEVIARAHYRGRVKRRMQRFLSQMPLTLAAGTSGRLADGRSFKVVDATTHADGRCEFLAVAALPGAGQEPQEPQEPPHGLPKEGIAYTALPLPYALPD
jgi:folate-binding protein YgfZ